MAYTEQRILEIVHELHEIPHLQLPLRFDGLLMQSELSAIDVWTYHSHAGFKEISAEEMQRISRGYDGASLYEFNGRYDYATDNYEIFKGREPGVQIDPVTQQVKFLSTALVEKMPYTASVVDQITARKGRTRVMRSRPNHTVVWHSHNRGPWFNSYMHEAIVHVPIKTNDKVCHAVRDYRHPRSQAERFTITPYEQLTQDPDIFVENYLPGESWIFNSWHDHYFHNYSNETRYTLIMYIRWFYNDYFVELVEKALNEYQGPRLAKDV